MDTNRERRIFIIDDEQPPNVTNRGFTHTHQEPSRMYNGIGVKRVGPPRQRMASHPHPNDGNDPPPLNLRALAASFFKKSSIYALNQIGNSKTLRRKIFWSFILIGGLIGCCSQVYRYLSAYYDYPVVINIDSVNLFNQQFPGVTICNLNNIRKSFFKCVLDKVNHQACEQSANEDPGGPEELEDAVDWKGSNCFTDSGELSYEFVNRMKFISLFYSLDETSRRTYGHQVQDFIKSCTFNGEECTHDHFTIHQDSMYGNCYTFNKAGDGKDAYTTSFVGPNSGLTVELNVQSDEYVWLTQSVGARVVIHDPHQEPTPQDQGVNVSPGFETTIGLSKIMMRRLPYPYKDQCKAYGVGDSKRLCDSVCFQKKVSRFCSCSMPSTKLEAKRYCDMTDVDALCCVYRGQKEEEDDLKSNVTCDCPLECVSSDYEMKMSSGVWPARPENLGEEHKSEKVEDVRETWVKLKVYYDTLEQLTYEQKPMFEDSEVLSQIGGQMGLWLGLSLAAMFECLENMVLLWHYRSRKT